MKFSLSAVRIVDAEAIVRDCDVPATRKDPLHLLIFPHTAPETEVEILWVIEGLISSLERNSACFRKVCDEDGMIVGFAEWSNESTTMTQSDALKSRNAKGDTWLPNTLDIQAWAVVSEAFRTERKRIVQKYRNIWRLCSIAVRPDSQRQGVGSLLMNWGCNEADRHGRATYVMASPAGIPLYVKFGFEEVGNVSTSRGVFTSMIREAHVTG